MQRGALKTSRWTSAAIALLAGAIAARSAAADDLLRWKSGDFKLKGIGFIQGDFRAFPGWDVDPDTPGLRADSADVRRMRIGVEGSYKKLDGELVYDFGNTVNSLLTSGDGTVAPSLRNDLKNAYLQLEIAKHHSIRAGHFKVPVSREWLTSVAKIDFIERSLLASGMAPGRDWGVAFMGKLPVARGLDYTAGVFAGDGWADTSRAGTTAAVRGLLEARRGLEIGFSASFGSVEADAEGGPIDPAAKGLRGESASGWAFFHRMHVDGPRRRLGADAQYVLSSITLKGEVLYTHDERRGQSSTFTDLPPVAGFGWSTVAVWRVRGPRSKKDASTARPLDLQLRAESLHFDDTGDPSGFEGIGNRARNIRPQTGRALTAGINYWPRPWIRVMGNAVVDRYSDGLLAPEQHRKGNYVTLLARVHVELP
jgi:phosphate-selective porin